MACNQTFSPDLRPMICTLHSCQATGRNPDGHTRCTWSCPPSWVCSTVYKPCESHRMFHCSRCCVWTRFFGTWHRHRFTTPRLSLSYLRLVSFLCGSHLTQLSLNYAQRCSGRKLGRLLKDSTFLLRSNLWAKHCLGTYSRRKTCFCVVLSPISEILVDIGWIRNFRCSTVVGNC